MGGFDTVLDQVLIFISLSAGVQFQQHTSGKPGQCTVGCEKWKQICATRLMDNPKLSEALKDVVIENCPGGTFT